MRGSRAIKVLAFSVLVVCLTIGLASTAFAAGGARDVTVDASKTVGAIRSLQGAHFDPGPVGEALSNNYVFCGVSSIRNHDANVADIDGVAVDAIFPDLSLDPNDPLNYHFGPADQFLKNVRAIGAEIFFRVGRSNIVSFSGGYPFVNNYLPADFGKYAEIAKHVVMHYNKGWANGYYWGIKYWEIWNEPDLLPFWAEITHPQYYYELYKACSLAIKSVYPQAKVGGPVTTTHKDPVAGMEGSFLQYVRDNKLPLDFYSFHLYTDHTNFPYDMVRYAQHYRTLLDSYGFKRTEVVNTEVGPGISGTPLLGAADPSDPNPNNRNGAGAAAFLAESFMYMQDSPITRAYMEIQDIQTTLTKPNYGFAMVGMLSKTPQRLWTSGGDKTGYAVLAGRDAGRRQLQVLISNYEVPPSLMGPMNLGGIPGNLTETVSIPFLGTLGTFTWLERYLPADFQYQNNEGYNLSIKNIPLGWGDLTIKQYRLDNENNMALVNTTTILKKDRAAKSVVALSGTAWAHVDGAGQGVDLIVVTGSTGSSK